MTNFSWIDGSIVGVYLLAVMAAGIGVRKFVGTVEDFLVAGREVKLYLGVASLAATEFGIVTCMYTAQNGYDKGFAGATPGILMAIAYLVVGMTGFCIAPMRDSGAMTLPEFFEKRLGRKVRQVAGAIIVLSGLLNMGVFLRMGGEFLIGVTGMSAEGHQLEIMMSALLIGVCVYTILGGMLSVLVTDFMQFVVMSIGLIAVTFLIIFKTGWGNIINSVESNYGPGGFNPWVNPDMGWSFIIFNSLVVLAAVLTMQPVIQRILSSKDSKTGQQMFVRTSPFFVARFVMPGIWGIAALTMFPDVDAIGGNSLAAMPKMLAAVVPVGLMGLLVAAMLAADMSTDSSYMLAYGSVIYNDIMGPFRKKPMSDARGILWNRFIVAALGIFFLFYGLWYPLQGPVWTYLTVTGTICFSGMLSILVGCCYWKRANDWGAMGAMLIGAIFPIAFLILEQVPSTKAFAAWVGPNWSGILSFAAAGAAMVIGSLIKPGHVNTPIAGGANA
jgi:SSS family solute:Na+ symporter